MLLGAALFAASHLLVCATHEVAESVHLPRADMAAGFAGPSGHPVVLGTVASGVVLAASVPHLPPAERYSLTDSCCRGGELGLPVSRTPAAAWSLMVLALAVAALCLRGLRPLSGSAAPARGSPGSRWPSAPSLLDLVCVSRR